MDWNKKKINYDYEESINYDSSNYEDSINYDSSEYSDNDDIGTNYQNTYLSTNILNQYNDIKSVYTNTYSSYINIYEAKNKPVFNAKIYYMNSVYINPYLYYDSSNNNPICFLSKYHKYDVVNGIIFTPFYI